jgi:MinD superfamily P-loop ATPase
MKIAIVDLTNENVKVDLLKKITSEFPAKKSFFVDGNVKSPILHKIFDVDLVKTVRVRGTKTGKIDNDPCIACLLCREACEFDAVVERDGYYAIDEEKCNGCGKCAHNCPLEGITFDIKDAGMMSVYQNDSITVVSAQLDSQAQDKGGLLRRCFKKSENLAEELDSFNIIEYYPYTTGCFHDETLSRCEKIIIIKNKSVDILKLNTVRSILESLKNIIPVEYISIQ